MATAKIRHRGMVIKPVQTPEGTRFRVPHLGGAKLFKTELAARRAIGVKRNRQG